jgi:hypothetical protein
MLVCALQGSCGMDVFGTYQIHAKTEMFTRLYLNHHLIILCICRLLL